MSSPSMGHRSGALSLPLISPNDDSCNQVDFKSPPLDVKPFSSTTPSFQRLRKRVPWRGKACIICLPSPGEMDLKVTTYLKPNDVERRLYDWQVRGYDIEGFGLSPKTCDTLSLPDLQAQTRSMFPDPVDISAERNKRLYRARIPDRAQWDLYVTNLREAKLRALGVFLSDNDHEPQRLPNPPLPDRCSLSRGSQLPRSPAMVPPRSADLLLTHAYGITSQSQDTPNSSSCTSPGVASDSQPILRPMMSQFPRSSIAQSQKHSAASLPCPSLPLQSFVARTDSFGKQPLFSRPTSPVSEGALQRPFASSDLSLHVLHESNDAVKAYAVSNDAFRTRQEQTSGHGQNASSDWKGDKNYPAGSNGSSMHLQESPNQDIKTTTMDLQYPIPRTHCEGIPEALERRVCDPAIVQTKRRKDGMSLQSRRSTSTSSITHSDFSEAAIVRRNAAESQDSRGRPNNSSQPGSAISALNALAPEFQSGISTLPSSSSIANTLMRPTAPPFTPLSASKVVPTSREFSFSSAGPSFELNNTTGGCQPLNGGPPFETNIGLFSTVTYPFISKPVKKSKAIPIQRPRNELRMSSSEVEVQEDESGRITQADGRQKRIRRSTQRAEQGPQYISSKQVPLPADSQYLNADNSQASATIHHKYARQESMSLKKATQAADQSKELIDSLSASESTKSREQRREDADPDMTAIDAARIRSNSTKIGFSYKNSDPNFHTNCSEFSDEQLVVGGSTDRRASSSPIPRTNEMAKESQNIQPLAESKFLKNPHKQESSNPFPASVIPSPGKAAVLLPVQPETSLTSNDSSHNLQGDAKNIPDGVSYIEPSYEEIDAIMKHLDLEDSKAGMKVKNEAGRARNAEDLGVLDSYDSNQSPTKATSRQSPDEPQAPIPDHSPRSARQHLLQTDSESTESSIVRMIAKNARFSPSYRPSRAPDDGLRPSLDPESADSAAISEWDNAFSLSDEARVHDKRTFLDARVNEVVGNALKVRLAPLERSLVEIRRTLIGLSRQSSTQPNCPDNTEPSDADDEDDVEDRGSRTRSPNRRQHVDKLKSLVAQVATVQHQNIPASDLLGITDDIKQMKTLFHESLSSFANLKTAIEETIGKNMRGRSGPIASSHQSATVEKNQLQITGLESMLKIAEGRAGDELKARRATEDALADSQRLLRLAMQDASEQRESAEETERSLSTFHEERHEVLRRNAILEGTSESLQKAISDLAEKNTALEGTLEEYRLSSAQWRGEIESTKTENSDLRRTMSALKAELEDGIRGRQALKMKLDQLQSEMMLASQNIAENQSLWRRKEDEYKAKCEVLVANRDGERQRCQKMAVELEALSGTLQLDREKHQKIKDELERDIRIERQHLQDSMDDRAKAAMQRLDDLQTGLGNLTASFETRIDQANQSVSAEHARYERLLQEAAASKMAAIQDNHNLHEQVVKDLTKQHEQSLQSVIQEKQSVEVHYQNRLALADEKSFHYQDKIHHLEEKLEITKSAAQAAAQAVQSKQPMLAGSHQRNSPSSTTLPERISPQALRESILVLQEQLQDRESQIEQLEQKLSTVDLDTPSRSKDLETEITWLRELFDVRMGDLQDLIAALAQPEYDREAVKEAAIRLKANLQMEQQEKERAQAGEQSFLRVSNFTNITSTPRSLPMAAAAAWGNWRKGRNAAISSNFGFADDVPAETPSRSSPSTQSILSGLLTPPRSGTKRNVQSVADERQRSTMLPPESSASNLQGWSVEFPGTGVPCRWGRPVTPPMTRPVDCDIDPWTTDNQKIPDAVGMQSRSGGREEEEEAFGPPIAAFSRHV